MKIIRLQAENIKRLRAVEITPDPDGRLVIIAGRNAQGKSSVLDSIWMALGGKGGQAERPIRDGERKAHVTLELDDILVTRKWTQTGSTLTVGPKDGSAKFNSPQAMLDKMIGKLSFDPLAFAQQDARSQLATLLDLVELPFDPTDLAAERKAAYEARTDYNRDVKRLAAVLDDLPQPPADTPDEEVDVADLAGQLQAAEQRQNRLDDLRNQHRVLSESIGRLERELAEAKSEREEVKIRGEALAGGGDVDRAGISQRIVAASDVNKAVALKRRRLEANAEEGKAVANAEACTKAIIELDEKKAAGVAAAKMPVEGLSFDEDGVLYNGVPFSQASAAERLRVSVAMAMALNPSIRVIRITDGSLLDAENLALIESMAREHDFQVWVERVGTGDAQGVVIEDGSVQA